MGVNSKGDRLPPAAVSEAQIATDAPAAMRALERLGGADLADMLGLGEAA